LSEQRGQHQADPALQDLLDEHEVERAYRLRPQSFGHGLPTRCRNGPVDSESQNRTNPLGRSVHCRVARLNRPKAIRSDREEHRRTFATTMNARFARTPLDDHLTNHHFDVLLR
jgi:hypothetical protein